MADVGMLALIIAAVGVAASYARLYCGHDGVDRDAHVTPEDSRQLEAIVADRSSPQTHAWRANIILATADDRRAPRA
jgi:hypothetical protein